MLQVTLKNRTNDAVQACIAELRIIAMAAAKHAAEFIRKSPAFEVAIADGVAVIDTVEGTIRIGGTMVTSIEDFLKVLEGLQNVLGESPAPAPQPVGFVQRVESDFHEAVDLIEHPPE